MSPSDLRFYGFISGCLLVAALFVALLLGAEGNGRVAELPRYQIQQKEGPMPFAGLGEFTGALRRYHTSAIS